MANEDDEVADATEHILYRIQGRLRGLGMELSDLRGHMREHHGRSLSNQAHIIGTLNKISGELREFGQNVRDNGRALGELEERLLATD